MPIAVILAIRSAGLAPIHPTAVSIALSPQNTSTDPRAYTGRAIKKNVLMIRVRFRNDKIAVSFTRLTVYHKVSFQSNIIGLYYLY